MGVGSLGVTDGYELTMWVQGIKSGSSVRVASALNTEPSFQLPLFLNPLSPLSDACMYML